MYRFFRGRKTTFPSLDVHGIIPPIMRGHIIAEDHFLHQGVDHHLFVTSIEHAEHEHRFEVRRILPGNDMPETEFEKTVDFSALLSQCANTTIDQLIEAELVAIKRSVKAEEEIHAHDP